VIFVITTDGQENSSVEFKADQIRQMVNRQEAKYNWNFLFLGANIDSFAEGDKLGFATTSTANYDASADGTEALYASVSSYVSDRRSHDARADHVAMSDYLAEARPKNGKRGSKKRQSRTVD